MRRINIKFLLIMTLAIFAVVSVGAAISYFNSDRASGIFLERAETAEK